jgi:ketosteroid isomerase-like protein
MSQENVELVRSIYAAWDQRDYQWVDWADPAIEFVLADGPAPGHWTGLAGMWQGWSEVLASWEDWRAEILECRDLDGERVLALFRFRGRGKTSGLEVGQLSGRGANVFFFRAGKVTKLVAYWRHENALADLGLEE